MRRWWCGVGGLGGWVGMGGGRAQEPLAAAPQARGRLCSHVGRQVRWAGLSFAGGDADVSLVHNVPPAVTDWSTDGSVVQLFGYNILEQPGRAASGVAPHLLRHAPARHLRCSVGQRGPPLPWEHWKARPPTPACLRQCPGPGLSSARLFGTQHGQRPCTAHEV